MSIAFKYNNALSNERIFARIKISKLQISQREVIEISVKYFIIIIIFCIYLIFNNLYIGCIYRERVITQDFDPVVYSKFNQTEKHHFV